MSFNQTKLELSAKMVRLLPSSRKFLLLCYAVVSIFSSGVGATAAGASFVDDAEVFSSFPNGLCSVEIENAKGKEQNHNDLMRLAVCLHKNGHVDKAFGIYQHVRKTFPTFSYVLVNLAVTFLKKGEIKEAREYLEQYLLEVGGLYGELPPLDSDAKVRGPPCQKSAADKADCVNALNNLAAVHLSDGKNASAVNFYLNRAIQIGDEGMLDNAYANLGGNLAKMGDHHAAAEAFIRAFWIALKNKGSLDTAVSLLVRRALLVPTVAASMEDVEKTRLEFQRRIRTIVDIAENGGSKFMDDRSQSDLFLLSNGTSNIEDIRRIPRLAGALSGWTAVQTPHFYLHYYGFHDLPLNKEVAEMFSILCPPSLFEVAPHLSHHDHSSGMKNPLTVARKKRVGFVSSLVGGDEPHGLLVLDVLRSLDGLFDLFVVNIGSRVPTEEFFKVAKGNVFTVGYDDVKARELLKTLELDCLVYLEAMNEAIVYFLGYQRFAKVQILVMGSPVTSGIPTFDYFVSGDLLEHPFRTQLAVDHYSEQVVLMDGQSISFPRQQEHPLQDSILAAGDAALLSNATALEQLRTLKSKDKNIYLCFQSIFKIQPAFDHVLIDILQADQKGQIVLQASRSSIQTTALETRLKTVMKKRFCGSESIACSSMVEAHARITFLPRVRSDEVIDVMKSCSVILHPFPFGGSKTASDALNAGVPLVTFPQRYLRGRMAAVFLKSVLNGVDADIGTCCIANTVSDYVSKALRLATDKNYRSRVSDAIKERSHKIWDDKMVSFEWGRLLTRALGIRISDGDIALHMRFAKEERHQNSNIDRDFIEEQSRWKQSVLLSHQWG